MNITTKQAVIAAAILAAGYWLGRRAKQSGTAPTQHNEIGVSADWWSYAGSWAS